MWAGQHAKVEAKKGPTDSLLSLGLIPYPTEDHDLRRPLGQVRALSSLFFLACQTEAPKPRRVDLARRLARVVL